jgi:type II secretory pathway component GspD/PulD (secretin)
MAAAVLFAVQSVTGAQVRTYSPGGRTVVIQSDGSGPVPPLAAPGAGGVPAPTSSPANPAAEPETPEAGSKEASGRPPERSSKPEGPDGKDGKSEKDAKKPEGEKGDDKTPEEASKPVERPTEPPQPPDPQELKVRPDAEGKIRFNFSGQKWADVLQWLADISAMSLDWQEVPGGYLNLITQRAYSVEEARDLINLHLLARGFTLLEQDEVLSVVNIEKLNPAVVPRVSAEELDRRRPHEFVKVSFALDWLLAAEAAEELKPMLSRNGKLTPLKTTIRLEEIYAVLNQEQSGDGEERLVREFPLLHSAAEEVLTQLNTLLGIEKKPAGPMSKEQIEQAKQEAMMRAQQQQQQQQQKGGISPPKRNEDVTLVANRRRNSIVAQAPPDKMAVIEQAIKLLDVPSDHAQSLLRNPDRMQVYRLESIDPEALVKSLEEMGDLDFDSQLEVDRENKAIIAYASLADHLMIRSLIEKLDQGGRRSEVIPLVKLRAESVVATIDFMMGGGKEEKEDSSQSSRYNPYSSYGGYSPSRSRSGGEHSDKFCVDADVKNNALLLWCNEFELAKVEELLDNLREMAVSEGELQTVEVYRLVAIDPKVLITTLEDMNYLAFRTTLEADEENNSIVAHATPADQEKIRALIEDLDGSGREFEVIQLRRLEADYVAGSIQFMMSSGSKESESLDRYSYYPYTSRMRPEPKKDTGEFRIEADVEFNRLLLFANDVELEEVRNLLVKLGEIPAEGGDPRTIRVIDTLPDDELEKVLERIKRAWPSVAPNPLLLEPSSEPKEKSEKTPTSEQVQPTALPQKDATADAIPIGDAAGIRNAGPSFVRLARLEVEEEAATAPRDVASADDADSPGPEAERPPTEADPSGTEASPGHPGPPAQEGGRDPSPVSISRGPDGRLVISSQDTQALDRLEELFAQLAPPREDYRIFRLKYGWAFSVALTLEDIFEEEKEEETRSRYSPFYYDFGYSGRSDSKSEPKTRLSKRRPLKFISDSDSNTILVQGADPAQMAKIEKLIELYDQPEPTDSQSVRKTQIIRLRYSQASVVAETVKEVYRDLLSTNDKSLVKGQPQRQTPERSYTYIYDSTASGSEERMPSFKGLLSIGVDDLSNTLVVSAPAFLMDDLTKIIDGLDEAAESTVTTVRVMQMGRGVSAAGIQEALSSVLGGSSGSRKPVDKPPLETLDGGGNGARPGRSSQPVEGRILAR